jgi:hypothetical protein
VSTTTTTNVSSQVPIAHSVKNLTGKAVRLYSGTGGSGVFVCYGPGADLANTALASGSVKIQSQTAC